MRAHVFRFPLFCVLMFYFPVVVMSGPGQVAGNSVDFDPPPKGGANPDRPAKGAITATGITTSAKGYLCLTIEVTVKDLATQKVVDTKMAGGGATWKYAGQNFASQVSHSVGVKATWSGPMGKMDDASVGQTVTTK